MIADRRGSVVITTLAALLALLVIAALVFDVARLYGCKVSARHGLNLSLRAAASQLDPDALARWENPRAVILAGQARDAFYAALAENLLIPDEPPPPGSVADGPVEVLFFRVVNKARGENPAPYEAFLDEHGGEYTYHYGDFTGKVREVSVVGIIRVPVRLSGMARAATGDGDEYVDLLLHSVAGPEVIPKT